MFSLSYRGVVVDSTTYCLEWVNEDNILCFDFAYDEYAYNRLVIKAFVEKLTGYIVYPMTRSRQKVVNGELIKRGRKISNTAPLYEKKVKFGKLTVPDSLKPI